MGRNFAEYLVQETGIPLEQQIATHFSTNCYPPIPHSMIPIAVQAINACLDEQYDLEIELPLGVTFRNSTTITAINAVDNLRLDSWTTNYGEAE